VLKADKNLSERTKAEYKRGAAQVRRVLAEQGRKTPWDLCAYLVETALTSSVSTYKRPRAMVLRLVDGRENTAYSAAMVLALPPYAEMCAMLGRTPSRLSTAVTEARRAAQNERIFTRQLGHLSPEHRDAFGRLVGAPHVLRENLCVFRFFERHNCSVSEYLPAIVCPCRISSRGKPSILHSMITIHVKNV
jgi:hypothetical protein